MTEGMQKHWARSLRIAGLDDAEIARMLGVSREWLAAL